MSRAHFFVELDDGRKARYEGFPPERPQPHWKKVLEIVLADRGDDDYRHLQMRYHPADLSYSPIGIFLEADGTWKEKKSLPFGITRK